MRDDIQTVKRRYSAQLLAREEVSGLSVERDSTGEEMLVLHVSTNEPQRLHTLPSILDGYPVRIAHSGPYRAQNG